MTSNAGLRALKLRGHDFDFHRALSPHLDRAARWESDSPASQAQINGRRRRHGVKGDAVSLRHNRQLIGADFVGEVTVCRDTVGADQDDINFASRPCK